MRTSDALRGVSCLNDHRFMSEALFLSMADLFVFFSVKLNEMFISVSSQLGRRKEEEVFKVFSEPTLLTACQQF